MAVIAVLVAIIVVVALVVVLAAYVRRAPDPTVPREVLVRLYEIRKRMDVALFRVEARSESDRIRRELRRELQERDQAR